MVLLFLTVQLLAAGVLAGAGVEVALRGDIGLGEVAGLATVQSIGIAAVAVLVLLGATNWRRLWGTAPVGPGFWALSPVGLLVIGPTFGAALASDDPVLAPTLTPALAAAFIGLAMLIGVNEELWFRGLVLGELDSAGRRGLTVIGAALLFGLPHLGDSAAHVLNTVAVTLAVGVPFTVVRLRRGSLVPLVGWHALVDIWAFLHTASVTPQGSPDTSDVVATLVLPTLVAAGYVWWYRRTSDVAPTVSP